jgi:class 3 adenylate cyclase
LNFGAIIIKYSGTLERYAGDGVMIVFNDPVPVEKPAHPGDGAGTTGSQAAASERSAPGSHQGCQFTMVQAWSAKPSLPCETSPFV